MIYDLKCKTCGKEWTVNQTINDPNPDCECGGKTEKLISSSTFILKGKGWAKDGYAKGEKDGG